jgi:hypothetical protein
MNRLWVRLILAFLSVALVVVIIVAGLAGWSTGDQFHAYVAERNQAVATLFAGRTPNAPKPANAPPAANPNHSPLFFNPNQLRDDHFPPGAPPPRSPEDRFLDRLYITLIIAALVAGGVGTLL